MDVREKRFRAKVEDRGDHELWTGAVDASGTGLVRIDGKLRTVQRAAWEFAHGALSPGQRVLACSDEQACVRLEHLQVTRSGVPVGPSVRRRRGGGSMHQVRAGVWKLTVSDGTGPDGTVRRRHLTVQGTSADARARLANLAETTDGPTRLGDMRVRELVDRYITWLDGGRDDEGVQLLRKLAEEILEPAMGHQYAALIDGSAVAKLLREHHNSGGAVVEVRELHELLAATYRWAESRRWTTLKPTTDVSVNDVLP